MKRSTKAQTLEKRKEAASFKKSQYTKTNKGEKKKMKKRSEYTNKEAIFIILFYLISFILIEWLFITLGLATLEHFMRLSVA